MMENPDYLTKQLISYLGNKRTLFPFIEESLITVKQRLGQDKLSIFDVFSGSGAVARFFKQHTHLLVVNDLEDYACTINQCYLANKSEINLKNLQKIHSELLNKLHSDKLEPGLIATHYAPKEERRIKKTERAFYTPRNARYLDSARLHIGQLDTKLQNFFLAPLLAEASIHANTSGVFKGFYKSKETGRGQFGGTNKDALTRIMGDIELPFPVFSNFDCVTKIFSGDSNEIATHPDMPEVDLAYLDPPYNQHPYGSNYFMLNLLIKYQEPQAMSRVSGIPSDWKRSAYNSRKDAAAVFLDLVQKIKAKYLLVSFNSEGFISKEEMLALLKKVGKVEVSEKQYNTFRASRNLNKRAIHVKEFLFLVQKK